MGRGNATKAESPSRAALLNLGSTRILHPQELRDFVECLPCGVVTCHAQQLVLPMVAHEDELGVPAGDEEAQGGKPRIQTPFRAVECRRPPAVAKAMAGRKGALKSDSHTE